MTTKHDSYVDDAFEIYTRLEDKFERLTGSKDLNFEILESVSYAVVVNQESIPDNNFSRLIVETNKMFGDNWAWNRHLTEDDIYDHRWAIYFKYEEDATRFMITYPSKFLSRPVQ